MKDELFPLVGLPASYGLLARLVMTHANIVAVAHTPKGVTVFNSVIKTLDILDEYTYAEFDIPELNHSGWSDVSGTEEVMMLTEMAMESVAKAFWFNPNEDLDERLARDIARVTGISTVSIAGEIRNLMSPNTYMIHNHNMRDVINEIACKSIEQPKIKEIPHYRDLEFGKKRKRF